MLTESIKSKIKNTEIRRKFETEGPYKKKANGNIQRMDNNCHIPDLLYQGLVYPDNPMSLKKNWYASPVISTCDHQISN